MKWNTRNTPSVQKWAHVSRLQTDNHGTVVRDANGKDTGNRRPVGGRLAAPIVEVELDKWGRVITRCANGGSVDCANPHCPGPHYRKG
jgi:hypothetical protein